MHLTVCVSRSQAEPENEFSPLTNIGRHDAAKANRDMHPNRPSASLGQHASREHLLTLRMVLLGATAIAIPASFIAAPYPEELILQHIPTAIGIGLLVRRS